MKHHKHTTEEFITLATAKHNNKYSYTKTQYTGSNDKVTIACPIHGDFEQRAANHLNGRGCPKCKNHAKSSKAKTTEQFIAEAELKHNNFYSYENTKYTKGTEKVVITCPIHGEFSQFPSNHLRGSGCAKCGTLRMAGKQRDSLETFVKKAREVFGDRYMYKPPYTTARLPVTIICPVHGEFQQLPTNHLKGVGCPSCSGGVFNPSKETYLYYLSINDGQAYKFGITTKKVRERFTVEDIKKIEILYKWKFRGGCEAYEMEQHLLQKYKLHQYTGEPLLASGNTELLDSNVLTTEDKAEILEKTTYASTQRDYYTNSRSTK